MTSSDDVKAFLKTVDKALLDKEVKRRRALLEVKNLRDELSEKVEQMKADYEVLNVIAATEAVDEHIDVLGDIIERVRNDYR